MHKIILQDLVCISLKTLSNLEVEAIVSSYNEDSLQKPYNSHHFFFFWRETKRTGG